MGGVGWARGGDGGGAAGARRPGAREVLAPYGMRHGMRACC